jgi:hypothetical protein
MARAFRLIRLLVVIALLASYPTFMLLLAFGPAMFSPTRSEGMPDFGSEVAPAKGDGVEDELEAALVKLREFRSKRRGRLVVLGHEDGAEAPSPSLPKIEPNAPLASLLPTPPKSNKAPVYVGDDLACVPELALEAVPAEELTTEQWKSRKALASAAALHLNGKEEDGFLKALVRSRPDLAGVPFVMGDACRTKGDRRVAFKQAAEKVRSQGGAALLTELPPKKSGEETRHHFWQAHTVVTAQVMPTEGGESQLLLIRALASVPRPEATRELARVAVFATEEPARAGAIEALAVRRARDYTSVLVAALRYPWPAVASNAARAIGKLGRKELAPELVALLGEPDPRSPRTEKVGGVEQTVAPELVRINHLRNCLLCHAPAEPGKVPEGTLVAEVPVPSEQLPDTRNGYGDSGSNLLVRIDVTYLRQDFSAVQEVSEKSAWPAGQRFDFVVRKRVLTPAEADDLRARLAKANAGGMSPYQRAAAQALRDLTGRDYEARPSRATEGTRASHRDSGRL